MHLVRKGLLCALSCLGLVLWYVRRRDGNPDTLLIDWHAQEAQQDLTEQHPQGQGTLSAHYYFPAAYSTGL